ncbi:MAG: ABC transporter permease [Alphaproteobacteria bacterium]|nr:ABC transporter permease [Alphaproteobacteria bacterium]
MSEATLAAGGLSAARPASRPGIAATGRVPQWVITLAVGLVVPALLACGIEGLARTGVWQHRLLPIPSQIGAELHLLWQSGELVTHLIATTARVAAGFLIGAVAATLLGILTGTVPVAFRLLDPTLQALRAIPSIAWVPLFILWLGIFEASKVALIALGCFFPIYLALAAGLPRVDRGLIELGQAFGVRGWRLTVGILLPSVLPAWLTGLRGGLGLGWMFVVAAELMGASEGLGYLLTDGQQAGRPQLIVAAILLFAVLGKLSDAVVAWVTRRALVWQDCRP